MIRRPIRQRRRTNQGFTLVEVMMAVTVLTVGSLGLMALQQASTRGNMEARQMTIANGITRTWMERVRIDAEQFSSRGPTGAALTTYLSGVAAAGTAAWETPPAVGGRFPAADWRGEDVAVGAEDTDDAFGAVYCTNIRSTWITTGTIRVDVRTYWHRPGADFRNSLNCATNAAAVTAALDQHVDMRAVYASTVVRWSPPN